MKTLDFNEMENVEGGCTQEEYCDTLRGYIHGDGYQGSFTWLLICFGTYC